MESFAEEDFYYSTFTIIIYQRKVNVSKQKVFCFLHWVLVSTRAGEPEPAEKKKQEPEPLKKKTGAGSAKNMPLLYRFYISSLRGENISPNTTYS